MKEIVQLPAENVFIKIVQFNFLTSKYNNVIDGLDEKTCSRL